MTGKDPITSDNSSKNTPSENQKPATTTNSNGMEKINATVLKTSIEGIPLLTQDNYTHWRRRVINLLDLIDMKISVTTDDGILSDADNKLLKTIFVSKLESSVQANIINATNEDSAKLIWASITQFFASNESSNKARVFRSFLRAPFTPNDIVGFITTMKTFETRLIEVGWTLPADSIGHLVMDKFPASLDNIADVITHSGKEITLDTVVDHLRLHVHNLESRATGTGTKSDPITLFTDSSRKSTEHISQSRRSTPTHILPSSDIHSPHPPTPHPPTQPTTQPTIQPPNHPSNQPPTQHVQPQPHHARAPHRSARAPRPKDAAEVPAAEAATQSSKDPADGPQPLKVTAEATSAPQVTADGSKPPQVTADGSEPPQVTADGSEPPQVTADGSEPPMVNADGPEPPMVTADGRQREQQVVTGVGNPAGATGVVAEVAAGATGVVAPGTGVVHAGEGVAARETGVVTPGTAVVAAGTGVAARETGVVTPGTAVVAAGTGVPARETGVVTPGTAVVAAGTGVASPRNGVVAAAPATGLTLAPGVVAQETGVVAQRTAVVGTTAGVLATQTAVVNPPNPAEHDTSLLAPVGAVIPGADSKTELFSGTRTTVAPTGVKPKETIPPVTGPPENQPPPPVKPKATAPVSPITTEDEEESDDNHEEPAEDDETVTIEKCLELLASQADKHTGDNAEEDEPDASTTHRHTRSSCGHLFRPIDP
ncbi:uncharacterized protein PGTG_20220 [Puccinia graminis f. sp. tritici CRL 75-36-700-3]|uniref:Uncharacterized protein n=1 Tax=Puccinia graminis f. sp. tritici (strain CRL 75-36-700-3 / race SCCL) TaxID=418459 RepID=E3LC73_PUCGT|nr:uncharacterized protein PGTG_20220 [Puccinia graminis f. sp. tritici CRL 75-36-700-3]EFP94148.2 hypothetical protein PGTG_20220 [Puccinia graminis f. sp. tritici CRL 75-36-700-3]